MRARAVVGAWAAAHAVSCSASSSRANAIERELLPKRADGREPEPEREPEGEEGGVHFSRGTRGTRGMHKSLSSQPPPPPTKRIIGGAAAEPSRHPYVASLRNGPDGATICGGTLVAPDVVLSAAHCAGVFDHVAIGFFDVQDNNYDVYAVEFVAQHPWYRFTDENMDIGYDFLLVKLNRTVDADYEPVALNRDERLPRRSGDSLTVLGWGATDLDGREMSDVLRRAEVEYVPNDMCEMSGTWIDGRYYSYRGFIRDDMLCAWGDRRDACRGDSGGPLIVEGDDIDDDETTGGGGDVQVGVVSFGVGCADPDFPAIYARVSDQLWWIDAVICGLSADPPADFDCEARADYDGDGVPDAVDLCPEDAAEGPKGALHGCPDEDEDGVPDAEDLCAETPAGSSVGLDGCPTGTPSPTPAPTIPVSLAPTHVAGGVHTKKPNVEARINFFRSPFVLAGIGGAILAAIGLFLWTIKGAFCGEKKKSPKRKGCTINLACIP